MIKQITIFALASLCLMACGGTATNTNTTANATNTVANTAPTNTNTVNANANANTAKPASSDPKRISFSKGADNTVENLDLEPGQSKKFVVGARKGQDLTIADADQAAKITMLTKGKLVDINDEPGNYNATTIANGDIVFEISNPTKKKIKASINVMIVTIGDD
ncbi:MAG: hypothetical protein IPI64_12340 [Chloracidobacterium sp.]|nr:hypothetical protein [Chloracidobacterium sp.]